MDYKYSSDLLETHLLTRFLLGPFLDSVSMVVIAKALHPLNLIRFEAVMTVG